MLSNFFFFVKSYVIKFFLQSEIFKAFEKTRLLVGDKKESQYSRCGRTDKGVSSVGQVSWCKKIFSFDRIWVAKIVIIIRVLVLNIFDVLLMVQP